jgi:molecular chaperone IbpA
MRSTFDFTPYRRSTIGFDRLFDLLEDSARAADTGDSYPPFDVEQLDEDRYRISIAVAGFSREEIDITSKPNVLVVAGRKREAGERHFIHRGIAARAFERTFQLGDYVLVNSASLRDGLLEIELKRELPEAVKPRRIEIGDGADTQPRLADNDQERIAA